MIDRNKNLLFIYFAFIFIALSLDIFEEYTTWSSDGFLYHFAFEIIILTLTVLMFVHVLSVHLVRKEDFHEITEHQTKIENTVEVLRSRVKNFKHEYLNMVEVQFTEWGFTPMEKELGLLILKGYNFEEIARARGVTDKTARKQAVALYAKAKVKNRNEFSAWFFEELI